MNISNVIEIYRHKIKQYRAIKMLKSFIFGTHPLHKYLKDSYTKKQNLNLLDVGCGNHSPTRYKSLYPNIIYTGLDIAEYNLDDNDRKIADELLILNCHPKDFLSQVQDALKDNYYDFIIMSHVIEHLEDPREILVALASKIKAGGIFYLAFPAEDTIYFPSAEGTLNFYDDNTHKWIPSLREILNILVKNGCKPIYLKDRYQPLAYAFVGFFSIIKEYIKSKFFQKPMKVNSYIWSLYGFESIIIVQKLT